MLLVAAGTTAARAMAAGGGGRYRTAVATIGSVDQQLSGVGTVSAVNQASVSFPVAGTVASVPVRVGSTVQAGQVLARLSPTALNQAVNQANASLAAAQQTLAADQASQTESTATESASVAVSGAESADSDGAIRLTAAVSPRPSGSGSAKPAGGSLSRSIAQVTAAQQTLISAQRQLDQDLTAAESALASCQNALSADPTSPPPPTTPPTTPPATTAPGRTGAPASTPRASTPPGSTAPARPAPGPTTAADDGRAACLAAIAAAPNQGDAAKDRQARDSAERSLDEAIRQLEQLAQQPGATGGKPAGSGSGAGSSSRTGSASTGRPGASPTAGSGRGANTGTGTGTSPGANTRSGSGSSSRGTASAGPATAAQLAADQAQVDAAQAELVVARQNLAATVLTSPVDGTVGAISLTPGRTASTSSTITVIGSGQSQVSTTVGLADIDKVKVGDPATVKVDGISQPLTGKVSLIGILNSTSGSSTTYPVTILLDRTSQQLYDGSGASTQIQTAQVAGVLTVPSSAVHSFGQFSTVTVLNNGKPQTTRVTVGASGSDRTQILTGLKAGQLVVLADLNQKLPTSSA